MPKLRVIQNGQFKCVRCNKFLDKEHFQEDKKRKYGIKSFCKICHKEYGVEYYSKLDVKKKHNLRAKERHVYLRNKLFELYGKKCAICGFSDIRALQIDHILGGGTKDRVGKSINKYYKIILESKDFSKFQVLCANCNWIKQTKEYEK